MNKKATALIIDDEADIRELIEMAFMGIDINCILSPTITDGIRQLKKEQADFVITDMRLPDGDGIELVAHIQKKYPHLPVCVITAHGNMELAIKALKLGAFDFINKPFDLKQLRLMAQSALKLKSNHQDKKPVTDTAIGTSTSTSRKSFQIIGDSPVMKKLDQIIKKLARSQAPVFIHGESGTGKELVARNIHDQSARHDGPFIPVNCGAIPENLVESEFFGYKKGAFTGAVKDTPGLFTSANGGTLFLDEVADLPLAMQVKLLRAIQERAIRPIGGDQEIPIDIRILSATHKNLTKLVESHEFREDLYYRLNVISLGMPPLRKRQGDVFILTQYLLEKLAQRQGGEQFTITPDASQKLNEYDFPGNVRELENILERATTFCDNNTITATDIRFTNQIVSDEDENIESFDFSNGLDEEPPQNSNLVETINSNDEKPAIKDTEENHHSDTKGDIDDLPAYLEEVERNVIQSAMQSTNNNQKQAAEKLGMTTRSLRYKLQKYNIN
ncbi:MAG: sigma-54-dependent Fis family transcriptional regulator [Gammaproteobacteria bacterium]|nr:sigma-54-dependent Fis family transcriptional regulator [Gammaproteobacteria bacterium]